MQILQALQDGLVEKHMYLKGTRDYALHGQRLGLARKEDMNVAPNVKILHHFEYGHDFKKAEKSLEVHECIGREC